MAFNHPSSSKK